jgi:hypothetical protein
LEEDIATFDAFHCWLYTGRLKDPLESTQDIAADDVYIKANQFCKIWVFADMRGIPAMGNAAIDMMHERVSAEWNVFQRRSIDYIYKNTTQGSKLRGFVVDLQTKIQSFDVSNKQVTEKGINSEFLLEAVPALARQGEKHKRISTSAWTKLNRCQWHDYSRPGGKLQLESRKQT